MNLSDCSNCTFMELKSASERSQPLSFLRSNCTFMELKWKMGRQTNGCNHVLIVPLWNWNRKAENWQNPCRCSNCTFMELKSLFSLVRFYQKKVLIVPLWNWNGNILLRRQAVSCSNCTFMELKLLLKSAVALFP